jgi:hypothetical protein
MAKSYASGHAGRPVLGEFWIEEQTSAAARPYERTMKSPMMLFLPA